MIDEEFIMFQNRYVQNIAMYVNPNLKLVGNQKISLESLAADKNKNDALTLDNTEQFGMNQGKVHMY